MTTRPPTWLVAIAVPALALVAVVATRAVEGSSDSKVERGGANAVVIRNFAFAPPELSVTKGTSLEITNADGSVHTLTARNGSFDTGDLDGGATTRITLEQSGTFAYYCEIHNYMTGTLEVN